MKKITYIVAALLILITSWISMGLLMPVVSQQEGIVYYLKAGTSKILLVSELSAQGIIRSRLLFELYVGLHHDAVLKSGEYRFPQGSTPLSIWKQVTTGTGLFYRAFTIIPGWSFKQLRNALLQTKELRPLLQSLNDQQVMERLGYAALSPEGEFFPETYYYSRDIPDLVILKRAFDLMQKKLNTAWQQRAMDLPYQNVYEALIAASLIEKEAYLDTERPMIAGVLINRLRKNMRLQFDPTVIYGMGDRYNGKIHKENLLENTPYNTYVHTGLPPTPIAMPSMLSIDAALHPAQHDYYYFVAKGGGAHQFSRNLLEHHRAVAASIQRSSEYLNEAYIVRYKQVIFSRKAS